MSVVTALQHHMAEVAASYESMFVKIDGVPQPKTNFMGKPYEQHIPLVVRALRAGDALVMAAHLYRDDPAVQHSIERLRTSMRETATCALYLDGKAGIQEDPALSTWAGCASRVALLAETSDEGVLSRALVTGLYEQQDPNGHIWEPLQDVLSTLKHGGADAAMERLAQGLRGFEDDNDLACVIGNVQGVLYDIAFAADTDADKNAAAELAFALHKAECRVMNSQHMINSAEELLDYEASYRLQREGARGSAGPRMG